MIYKSVNLILKYYFLALLIGSEIIWGMPIILWITDYLNLMFL